MESQEIQTLIEHLQNIFQDIKCKDSIIGIALRYSYKTTTFLTYTGLDFTDVRDLFSKKVEQEINILKEALKESIEKEKIKTVS